MVDNSLIGFHPWNLVGRDGVYEDRGSNISSNVSFFKKH